MDSNILLLASPPLHGVLLLTDASNVFHHASMVAPLVLVPPMPNCYPLASLTPSMSIYQNFTDHHRVSHHIKNESLWNASPITHHTKLFIVLYLKQTHVQTCIPFQLNVLKVQQPFKSSSKLHDINIIKNNIIISICIQTCIIIFLIIMNIPKLKL